MHAYAYMRERLSGMGLVESDDGRLQKEDWA